jgi:hypothetical protein
MKILAGCVRFHPEIRGMPGGGSGLTAQTASCAVTVLDAEVPVLSACAAASRKLVKEQIDDGNFSVPDDYEIGSGVCWWIARAARHPTDPPPIARHLRWRERLIPEVRMSTFDYTRDAVDFVATAVNAVGTVEYGVFVEDLVDRCASTHGINLSEHVMEVAKQQGRYSVGHFSFLDCHIEEQYLGFLVAFDSECARRVNRNTVSRL